ncbi:MAG TPA: hypothetical protein VNZ26_19750, partial [Vicinamibacterales bacterium]|nr:hypothetical protein [Vicinamibacterales bacterium]
MPQADSNNWTRFGSDVGRSNVSTVTTGINATNVASLQRQQVSLDGTVDSSAIYLGGATVAGTPRNVFFVTTIYGKT